MALKKTTTQKKAQSNFKFKVNLHKKYFETGWGILNYIKYFIAVFGAYSFLEDINLIFTTILLILFFIFCYVFGWFWLNKGWYEAEIEVSNKYNLFVQEMRKVYKLRLPK